MTQTIEQLMETSGVKFGTSGARGLVSALTDRVAYGYTLGFLKHLEQRSGLNHGSGVVIGGDLRPSTPRIMGAVAAACHALGYSVVNAGAAPSPAVALFGIRAGYPSIMVTGSHIPDDRNGIKFNRADGEIDKTDEGMMRDCRIPLDDELFDEAGMLREPTPMPPVDLRVTDQYAKRWRDFFPPGCLEGVHVGVYQHSTVGREILPRVLEGLGARVLRLGFSESFVPVDTEAIRDEDRQLASAWAAQHQLDAIISADGDADRPLLADERGRWIRGDVLGVLCARFVGARAVATPVSCNTVAEQCGSFETVARTRIGSPYVISAMQELERSGSPTVVGYEANGGFLQQTPLTVEGRTLSPLPTRDAVLPALGVLLAARRQQLTLSASVRALPPRFTASQRLQEFPTALAQERLARFWTSKSGPQLQAFEEDFGGISGRPRAMDVTDGIRVRFENDEIIHLRPSGNAPELRCYTEASTEQRADAMGDAVCAVMERWRK
jgi:phosphomannomutase